MSFILALVAAVVILIVPIRVAANYAQAGRTGVGACVFSVLVASALQSFLLSAVPSQWLAYLLAFAIVPLVFMIILDTTYKKGFVIAVVQLVLMSILILVAIAVLPGTVTISS